ncbi:hypothetical protein TNCV_2136181 [Trichonephila clavipes]|nr:hypothetical protein TNCV_2136181 [Trichonephila clavipes]
MGKRIDPTISIMSCLKRFPKDAKDVWAFSEEDETIVLSLATESLARFDFVGKALSVRLDVSCQGWRDEMVWGYIPMGLSTICNPEDDPLLYGRQCTVILEWVLSWDIGIFYVNSFSKWKDSYKGYSESCSWLLLIKITSNPDSEKHLA